MTSAIDSSIFKRIGDTPLIELRQLASEGRARILVKLESQNPTGSMKDRMALAMIEAARQITERCGGLWTDQLNNADQLSAYHRMGE